MRSLFALAAIAPFAFAQPTLTTSATLTASGTVTLTLTGTNLLDPVAVFTTAPGVTVANLKGVDATKVTAEFTVPKDAVPGVYPVRVLTKMGLTAARPLTVDPLPAVAEVVTNTKKATPQELSSPTAVVGTVAVESADYFRVPVKAGRRLTVEVVAKRLGSVLDPVIVLSDAATGLDLPGLYAEDTPGLQLDCRVSYVPKSDGAVVIELRDATYKGGPDFAYRLRVGEFPPLLGVFPVAAEFGKTVTVRGLGTDAKAELKAAKPAAWFAPGNTWAVPLRVSEFPEGEEHEPNNGPKDATPLAVPGGVSAGFFTKNDIDWFRFKAKRDQKIELTARAAELPAATEVLLSVRDAAGKEYAKSDPMKPTAKVEFSPPADGEFFAVCEPLNYQSGPGEVYHLVAKPVLPDFTVTAADAFVLPSDGPGVIAVTLTRSGYTGPVELSFDGVPGVTGKVTVPANAAGAVFLPVTAKGAKQGVHVGNVTATGGGLTRTATAVDPARIALAGLPVVPPFWSEFTACGVVPGSFFTLELKFDKLAGTVTLTRPKGFDDELKLDLLAPPGFTAMVPVIAKGKTSATFTAKADAKWPGGTVVVRGAAGAKVAVSNAVSVKAAP